MPKPAAQRKTPSCVLCGAYNATRRVAPEPGTTYPLCKQCHEGGIEHHGSEAGVAASIHTIATRNHALPLEQRKFVGDAHIKLDGTHANPMTQLATENPAAYRAHVEAQHRASGLFNNRGR